ncbi:hypothetical protein [Devosia sp. XK-2]|uniref:hypothetical protein n=1 Tax=Devosia sp. XK-2 TaxID=3126689 RepID=UPI0030CC1448
MHRRKFIALSAAIPASLALGASRAGAEEPVRMRELYNADGSFSDFALEKADKHVLLEGFMAPPLKAESRFFVLTKIPMSVCPFCDSEADWPRDIVSIYARDIITVTPFNVPIAVEGTLKIGTYTDEEMGFVSRVRVIDAAHWRA